jgi:hypothetical protein
MLLVLVLTLLVLTLAVMMMVMLLLLLLLRCRHMRERRRPRSLCSVAGDGRRGAGQRGGDLRPDLGLELGDLLTEVPVQPRQHVDLLLLLLPVRAVALQRGKQQPILLAQL